MQLHTLQGFRTKQVRRVGRGGKRGTTSGRGTKGQKSRAGHVIRPAVRDLIIRLPKRRGFDNKPVSLLPVVIRLGDLNAKLQLIAGKEKSHAVTIDVLKQVSLLPASFHKGGVKLLSDGDITFAITVAKGIKVSASAKAKIEKAGGKIE